VFCVTLCKLLLNFGAVWGVLTELECRKVICLRFSELTRGFETLDVNANLSKQHGIKLNGGFGTSGGDREIC
jgi:hypothetical protein